MKGYLQLEKKECPGFGEQESLYRFFEHQKWVFLFYCGYSDLQ